MARHLLALWVAICILAGTSGFAVWRGLTTQAHQNDALHAIICRAEHFVRTQPGISAAKRRQALRFYDQSLSDANLKPCD